MHSEVSRTRGSLAKKEVQTAHLPQKHRAAKLVKYFFQKKRVQRGAMKRKQVQPGATECNAFPLVRGCAKTGCISLSRAQAVLNGKYEN
jgi:hypothetical protein